MRIDPSARSVQIDLVIAVESTAELRGDAALVPPEAAAQLPKTGQVRVIVLSGGEADADAEWRAASYEQSLADDAPEDAVYESLR